MSGQGVKTGGCTVTVEGQASGFKQRTNTETGEISVAGSVRYWGGERYIRLDGVAQLQGLKENAWVKIACPMVRFGKQEGLGLGRVVEIDGKAVA